MGSMRRKEQFDRFRVACDEGHPALAVELGKLYLAKYPEDAWALIYFGMALQSIARYGDALAAYDRALLLLPAEEHQRIYRQFGLLAQDQADIEAAEGWYRRAIQALPTDATACIYLGAMLAKNGRLDEAEACHREATGCPEGCIDEAYLNLGYVLRAKGQYLDALECFREALSRDPLDTDVQEALEDIEQVLFRFPEA
jgi:tetratricopeptide (TPR) repeat protein